jgi:hypothetical protein
LREKVSFQNFQLAGILSQSASVLSRKQVSCGIVLLLQNQSLENNRADQSIRESPTPFSPRIGHRQIVLSRRCSPGQAEVALIFRKLIS